MQMGDAADWNVLDAHTDAIPVITPALVVSNNTRLNVSSRTARARLSTVALTVLSTKLGSHATEPKFATADV